MAKVSFPNQVIDPRDSVRRGFDFTPFLSTHADEIVSVVVSAAEVDEEGVETGDAGSLEVELLDFTTKKVLLRVSEAELGKTYYITCEIETVQDDRKNVRAKLVCKDQ